MAPSTVTTAGTGWSRTPGSARIAEGRSAELLTRPRPRPTCRRHGYRRRRNRHHRRHSQLHSQHSQRPAHSQRRNTSSTRGEMESGGRRCWRSRLYYSSWSSWRSCRGLGGAITAMIAVAAVVLVGSGVSYLALTRRDGGGHLRRSCLQLVGGGACGVRSVAVSPHLARIGRLFTTY